MLRDDLIALHAEALRRAAESRRRERAMRARAEKFEHAAALLESTIGELDTAGLQSRPKRSMFGSNVEAAQPKNVRIAQTRTRRDSEAKAACLAAGLPDGAVAAELEKKFRRKVGRSTVNAWMGGTRAIPGRFADYLQERHGIPRSAWRRVD